MTTQDRDTCDMLDRITRVLVLAIIALCMIAIAGWSIVWDLSR